MSFEIVHTKDGSNTIYSKDLDATFHSINGAFTESKHVFIEHGLKYVHSQGKDQVQILEIGFGTGLNAMLSLVYALEHKLAVNYVGIEKYEFQEELIVQLDHKNCFPVEYHRSIDKIIQARNEESVMIDPHFQLLKHISDISDMKWDSVYDIIYFDAFSPRHLPHLWTEEILAQMYKVLSRGGVLVTFCAQGQFKRDLKAVGFRVEKLPGAPGKREMTRGQKDE